ncbi:MAG: DNA-binding transcriptional regulator, partial [Anaerohalosphaera sp.]|nr:DNA-binding transcriptional regulator [Anaerohalosphaera sp.]
EASRTCERDFLRGVAKYSRHHGPWAFYRNPKYYIRGGKKRVSFEQIRNWKPDGIIVSDTQDINKLLKLKVPLIVHTVKRRYEQNASIVGDCAKSGKMAAEHLLSCGFENFAFCGLGKFYWSRERYDSFKKTLADKGFTVDLYEQMKGKRKRSHGAEQEALAQWLDGLKKPVGLMACADDCSQSVVEACKIAGIKVPDEVAVIGVDNDDMVCELSNPPLSSIALDFVRAGYVAGELMSRLIDGEETNESIVVQPTHVVVRESTDIMAVDDSDVATAVRFIRQNAKKLIQVPDVLGVVECSRRSLHSKFIDCLGRTVHEEIKRSRIEQIALILIETDKTVAQIAFEFGYNDANHIARYFRQAKGISPGDYRKKYGHIR